MGVGSPELRLELRGHLFPPAARRIEELQDSLQKKDADLRAMEERYRRYVDKARMVRVLGDLLPRLLLPIGSCLPVFCTCSLPPRACHISSCHRLLHHGHELSHVTYPKVLNSCEANVTLTVSSPTPRSYRPWNPSSGHPRGYPQNSTL